ncbi:MAG: vWA domain-containing protein [Planctomycetota bacterium]
MPPKTHKAGVIAEKDRRHLVVVLDVSPSMRLVDAGPTGKQSRMARSADLLKSFFERVPLNLYRTSVVATYNGAKPVVVDTHDMEVINNILGELPMHYAFESGKTDIFAGIQEAAQIARPWNPRSTLLILLSDGDTVPATGMPKMPASIRHSLIVGVGDTKRGTFIDGHQSRQDASTLRGVAIRLGGTYHNGNEKHLSTDLINQISGDAKSIWEKLTKREYAWPAAAAPDSSPFCRWRSTSGVPLGRWESLARGRRQRNPVQVKRPAKEPTAASESRSAPLALTETTFVKSSG